MMLRAKRNKELAIETFRASAMIIRLVPILCIALFISACNNVHEYNKFDNSVQLDDLNRPIDSTTFYFNIYEMERFPERYDIKAEDPERYLLDSSLAAKYSSLLYAMKEPTLSVKFLNNTLRYVEISPINITIIRFEKGNNSVNVIIKTGKTDTFMRDNRLLSEDSFILPMCYWDSLLTFSKAAKLYEKTSFNGQINMAEFKHFYETQDETGYFNLREIRITEEINEKEEYQLFRYIKNIQGKLLKLRNE